MCGAVIAIQDDLATGNAFTEDYKLLFEYVVFHPRVLLEWWQPLVF